MDVLLREAIGRKNLNNLFKLCEPIEEHINKTLDVATLFASLSDNFAGIAQYNKDNRLGKHKSNITLDTLCNIMTNQTLGPQVERLAEINNLILASTNETCLDFLYENAIDELRNTSWDGQQDEGGKCFLLKNSLIDMIFLSKTFLLIW